MSEGMGMTTFRFKFRDQATAHQVGIELGFLIEHKNEEGDPFVTAAPLHCWSESIPVDEPTGTMIQTDFGEYPERVPVEGYHCNIQVPVQLAENQKEEELFAELYGACSWVVFPKHPQQIFL